MDDRNCFPRNLLLIAAVMLTAAQSDGADPDQPAEPSEAGGAEAYVSLFPGDSLDGWTQLDGRPPGEGWILKDGLLHLDRSKGRVGHIVSERLLGDFDLRFEWKIKEGGNNGLKYRVRRYGQRVLGCEYQLLDDLAHQRVSPKHSAGALYALYEPAPQKKVRPAGQFNDGRIVVSGDRVEHWLNGQKIVSATIGDDEWERRVANSKFSEFEGFARNRLGRLMITDHGSEVWYRNLRLKTPPEGDADAPAE